MPGAVCSKAPRKPLHARPGVCPSLPVVPHVLPRGQRGQRHSAPTGTEVARTHPLLVLGRSARTTEGCPSPRRGCPPRKAVTSGLWVRLPEGPPPKPNAGRRWVRPASSSADATHGRAASPQNAPSGFTASPGCCSLFLYQRHVAGPLLPASTAATQLLGRAQLKT